MIYMIYLVIFSSYSWFYHYIILSQSLKMFLSCLDYSQFFIVNKSAQTFVG